VAINYITRAEFEGRMEFFGQRLTHIENTVNQRYDDQETYFKEIYKALHDEVADNLEKTQNLASSMQTEFAQVHTNIAAVDKKVDDKVGALEKRMDALEKKVEDLRVEMAANFAILFQHFGLNN
jgi:predicted  nucleic acid-binding Zn-ribbon protein